MVGCLCRRHVRANCQSEPLESRMLLAVSLGHVILETTATDGYVDMAADAAGNYVAIWRDNVTPNILHPYFNAGDLYARRFDADGQPLGNKFLGFHAVRSTPHIAMADDGRFVVAWQDY